MIILLAAIVVGTTGLEKLTENLFDDAAWTEELEVELANVEEELASPDLDEEEKAELEIEREGIQENIAYSIESSKPQIRESIIADTFGMMSIVTLLTIIVSSGIVSTEFSEGTIKMLLSRPVSRWKILTSKYLTILLFCLLATVVTYVSSVSSAFVLFPGATESTFMFYDTELAVSAVWGKSLYLMFLAFINAAIISTLAFTLGVVFRSTSLAIGISIFLYFTGSMIVMFLSKYAISKYILFAHTNLTQYETGFGVLDNITMPFSVGVIVGYWIIFLALSFLSFTKRDVTA